MGLGQRTACKACGKGPARRFRKRVLLDPHRSSVINVIRNRAVQDIGPTRIAWATRAIGATEEGGGKSKFGQAWCGVVHQSLAFGRRALLKDAAPCESRHSRGPPGMKNQRRSGPGAPQVQHGGRDADGDAIMARRIRPNLPTRLRPRSGKGSRAARVTMRIAGVRYPQFHRRSGWTMKQTVSHRKQIISPRHELAVINNKAAKPHPIC
jgi:hypothetical protein